MRLYIVRHAEAETSPPADSDETRELTEDGRKSVPPIAAIMDQLVVAPERIWTSPILRARQTADLLRDNLGSQPELEEHDFLGLQSDFNGLRSALKGCQFEELLLVGHMPFLGECVQYWLTGHAHPGMHVPKASLICLEARGFNRGNMNMKFMLSKKLMSTVAKGK